MARVDSPRDPEDHRMYGGDGSPKIFTPDEARQRLVWIHGQNGPATRSWVLAAKVWPDGRRISESHGRYVGPIS